ncbi:MAG TPA: hypothetical protein VM657_05265 [Sphingomonas sp.]|nr:hypothetical protein [Sphingomonas sp.]
MAGKHVRSRTGGNALAGAALAAAAPASAQDYFGSFLQVDQSHRVSELSQPEEEGDQNYRKRLLRDGRKWFDERGASEPIASAATQQ